MVELAGGAKLALAGLDVEGAVGLSRVQGVTLRVRGAIANGGQSGGRGGGGRRRLSPGGGCCCCCWCWGALSCQGDLRSRGNLRRQSFRVIVLATRAPLALASPQEVLAVLDSRGQGVASGIERSSGSLSRGGSRGCGGTWGGDGGLCYLGCISLRVVVLAGRRVLAGAGLEEVLAILHTRGQGVAGAIERLAAATRLVGAGGGDGRSRHLSGEALGVVKLAGGCKLALASLHVEGAVRRAGVQGVASAVDGRAHALRCGNLRRRSTAVRSSNALVVVRRNSSCHALRMVPLAIGAVLALASPHEVLAVLGVVDDGVPSAIELLRPCVCFGRRSRSPDSNFLSWWGSSNGRGGAARAGRHLGHRGGQALWMVVLACRTILASASLAVILAVL
mmetsp:Transcript_37130/g.78758  ORF Transcript_37130/g.78758 Transcript_37130/m.78758 type:complete len:392 (-) Transcript_37130:296-1471(-)